MDFPGSDHSRVHPELLRLTLKCTKMLSVQRGTLSELQNVSPKIASKPKSFSKVPVTSAVSRAARGTTRKAVVRLLLLSLSLLLWRGDKVD